MSLHGIVLIFFMGLLCPVNSSAITSSDFSNGINVALETGDFFRAYRTSIAYEEALPQEFLKQGLSGFFKSLFVVGSTEEIKKECGKYSLQSVTARYLCGLHFAEIKNTDEALSYLSGIDKKSKFFWPAQIITATSLLIKNLPEQALDKLKTDDLAEYKVLHLQQLFYLTRSRVLLALGRFEESVQFSQSVDSYSNYYVEALEQTAWAFFKIRKFESAQILLDVLISSYESPKKIGGDLVVSPTLYYRSRYLKAYLALLEQRPEGASNEFSQLKGDYEKFLKTASANFTIGELSTPFKGAKALTDMKALPPAIESHMTYMSEWLGAEVSSEYEGEVRFQVALNKEIDRLGKMKATENLSYISMLNSLKKRSYDKLQSRYQVSLKKLNQAMETLSLKSELGRLDVFWLNRAQGARNLDEVIENYKQTTKAVETYTDL